MKRIRNFLFIGILILASFLPIFKFENASASANDFYFKSFNADYYLKKKSDNTSEMEVVETLTAVFPDKNQNHGIERRIPFLNQNDTNLTMESTDRLDISVTRNGEKENFTVKAYDDYFNVRIGNADTYVHGEQTYVLKYKFIHVITDFSSSGYSVEPYQELYWDSNGTGWSQRFNEINVNLHMDKDILKNVKSNTEISKTSSYKDKSTIHENNKTKDQLAAWCYVGRLGSNGQNRCEITDLKDGINFNAKNLSASENLTFVANFNKDTFKVPENDFIKKLTFKDITADYYLSKNDDGTSNLKVKESVKVLFPTLNTERGLEHLIPYTNHKKNSFISDNQEKPNLKVTMDGEEIEWSSTNDDGVFDVLTGNSRTYVHGEHTINFEYEFKNIIEEVDDEDSNLYQLFSLSTRDFWLGSVDAIVYRVHLDDNLKSELLNTTARMSEYPLVRDELTGEAWCYASTKNGYSTSSCTSYKSSDGFTFLTNNLEKTSGFVFGINFKKGTFVVPGPNHNYLYYFIFAFVFIVLSIIVIIFYKRSYEPIKSKVKYLKNRPIAPEYTPLKGFTAAEMAEVYVKPTKNPKVATMLELVVGKKIELIKGEKKTFGGYKWKVKIKSLTGLSNEQIDLLKILNGGKTVTLNQVVEITSHSYSSSLNDAFKDFDSHIKDKLEKASCFVKNSKNSAKTLANNTTLFFVIFGLCFFSPLIILIVGSVFYALVKTFLVAIDFTPYSIYEGSFLLPITIILTLIVFTALPILSGYFIRYKKRTEKGLDMSNYMEGLKLYIKMAEKDRLEFLQSIEGADTSEEGIVKLYEKLLPYAALFGLEKSWMNELGKYYELQGTETPDWYAAGFTYSVLNSTMRSAVARPIDTSSSHSGGGWSSSSGFSGGGGGGFSGGGGGGGGGGGW
ncbi:DUF2207 domain-containing protein [Candidatus Saccharibacteria bacterium]|nr:DUF2207 domain-containing protein [Candidatus Saccharibacteria bacterium]